MNLRPSPNVNQTLSYTLRSDNTGLSLKVIVTTDPNLRCAPLQAIHVWSQVVKECEPTWYIFKWGETDTLLTMFVLFFFTGHFKKTFPFKVKSTVTLICSGYSGLIDLGKLWFQAKAFIITSPVSDDFPSQQWHHVDISRSAQGTALTLSRWAYDISSKVSTYPWLYC